MFVNMSDLNRICTESGTALKFVKMVFSYSLLLMLSALLLTGCSSVPSHVVSSKPASPLTASADLNSQSNIKGRLLKQYDSWKGTPYRLGGTSRRGVDCSGFVQNTFREQLGYRLPRTTRSQIKAGPTIVKSKLQVGDIVFFKTSSKSLHNGIYIGQSEFIHSSSSQGVAIASLDNQYWQKTYLTAIRVR